MARLTKEKKRQVLEYWVNNPTLTYADICRDMEIGDKTFYSWRHQDQFMEEYHKLCSKRFKSLQAIAVQKLGEKVFTGEFQAVKYVLDNQGYNATQKVEANVPTVISVSIEGE